MPTNDDDQLDELNDNDAPAVQDEPTINLTLSDLGDISDENREDIKESTGIIDNSNTLKELGDSGGVFDVTSADVSDVLGSLAENDLISEDFAEESNSTIKLDMQTMSGIDVGEIGLDQGRAELDVSESVEQSNVEKTADTQQTVSTPILKIESFEQQGQEFELHENRFLQVGREAGDIIICHRSISSNHCNLSNQGGIISITDLGSTNGTFVNGDKIVPRRMVILEESDQILIGQVLVSLRLPSEIYEKDLNEHGDTATVLMDGISNLGFEQVQLEDATSTLIEQETAPPSFSDLTSELPIESDLNEEDDSSGLGTSLSDDLGSAEDEMDLSDKTDLLLLQKQADLTTANIQEELTEEFDAEKHLRGPDDLTQTSIKQSIQKSIKKSVRETASLRDIINADKTDTDVKLDAEVKLGKKKLNLSSGEKISPLLLVWSTLGDIGCAFTLYKLVGQQDAIKLILYDLVKLIDKSVSLSSFVDISQATMVEDFLKIYLFIGIYRIVTSLILGTTLFQYLSGITSEASALKSRFSAIIREFITFIIQPLSLTNIPFKISMSEVALTSEFRKYISGPVLAIMVIMGVFSPYLTELTNSQSVLVQEMRVLPPNISDLKKLQDFNSKKLHFLTSHLNMSNDFLLFPVHKTISKNKKTSFIPGVATYSLKRDKGAFLYLDRKNPLKSMLRIASKKGLAVTGKYRGIKVLLESPKELLAASSTVELGQRVMDKNLLDSVESFVRDSLSMNRDNLISFVTKGNLTFTSLLEFRKILANEFNTDDKSKFYLSKIGDSRFLIIQNQEKQSENILLVEYLLPLDTVNGYVYRVETTRGKSDVLALRDAYNLFLANAQFEFDTIMANGTYELDSSAQLTDLGILLDNLSVVDKDVDIQKVYTAYGTTVRLITDNVKRSTDKNLKKHFEDAFRLDENYINFIRKKNKSIDDYFTRTGLKTSSSYLKDNIKK